MLEVEGEGHHPPPYACHLNIMASAALGAAERIAAQSAAAKPVGGDINDWCRHLLIDMMLRDRIHAVDHQFTPEQMAEVFRSLETADMGIIKVSHEDGMSGSSINYGFAAAGTEDYLDTVEPELSNTRLSVLLLPGIRTVEKLNLAVDHGADMCAITTHVTEADVSAEHFEYVKDHGLEADEPLMLSHWNRQKQSLTKPN